MRKKSDLPKLLICLYVIFQLTSCKTQYKVIEKTNTDTLYHTEYQYDSIYRYERQIIREKGDTIFITDEKINYKERRITDTVYIKSRIEVIKPIEVIKKEYYVPKVFRYSFAFSILVMGYIIWKIGNKYKLRK